MKKISNVFIQKKKLESVPLFQFESTIHFLSEHDFFSELY